MGLVKETHRLLCVAKSIDIKSILPSFFQKGTDITTQSNPSTDMFALTVTDIKSFLPTFFQKGGKKSS